MIVNPNFTDVQVKALIEKEYIRGGYNLGWSYIYSGQASRRDPEIVTIGLNPGGGRKGGNWSDDAHLIYSDSSSVKNAYFDQPWAENGDFTPLQLQIQEMHKRHFPYVPPEKILSFQLIPFRSPSWAEMPVGEHRFATQFGLSLLDWTLANLSSEATVIAFGLQAFEKQIAVWSEGRNPRKMRVGWGKVSARVWETPRASKLIFLPHLSRYRIFGRDEFVNEAKIFA